MPSSYDIETTGVSYCLSAHPSGDVATAAHQQITRDWWRTAESASTWSHLGSWGTKPTQATRVQPADACVPSTRPVSEGPEAKSQPRNSSIHVSIPEFTLRLPDCRSTVDWLWSGAPPWDCRTTKDRHRFPAPAHLQASRSTHGAWARPQALSRCRVTPGRRAKHARHRQRRPQCAPAARRLQRTPPPWPALRVPGRSRPAGVCP